jgi:hypothetical protein
MTMCWKHLEKEVMPLAQAIKLYMNEALRGYLGKMKQPLDEETLRRVIQEELPAAK